MDPVGFDCKQYLRGEIVMEFEDLFDKLKLRFEENMHRHEGLHWEKIKDKLDNNSEKLSVLSKMERTGGEPDVIGFDEGTGEYIFFDCSKESPQGRRNCCYDRKGQDMRTKKGVFPNGNAIELAEEIGIKLLTEEEYRELQKLEGFDIKTSSWLETPPGIRKLGGAIFGDRRYDHVFKYHNGAQSFYSSRGFRGSLRV